MHIYTALCYICLHNTAELYSVQAPPGHCGVLVVIVLRDKKAVEPLYSTSDIIKYDNFTIKDGVANHSPV